MAKGSGGDGGGFMGLLGMGALAGGATNSGTMLACADSNSMFCTFARFGAALQILIYAVVALGVLYLAYQFLSNGGVDKLKNMAVGAASRGGSSSSYRSIKSKRSMSPR